MVLTWVLIIAVLFVGGAALSAVAWHLAGSDTEGSRARASLLGGLGVSVVTGLMVTLAALYLGRAVDTLSAAQAEEAAWRANVATAASIPGFDPHGHDVNGLNLSEKSLQGADLREVDLRGVKLNGTDLRGADLTGADLRGFELYGAQLQTAVLTGARLAKAHLQGARLDRAAVEGVRSLEGAEASSTTCWPSGFLELEVAQGIEAAAHDDGEGHETVNRGAEFKNCVLKN
jgi:uncharacterized protein YjbI with pentapeptide repeats